MGRLPYRSRALGTVMAAAAGGDYRQRRRGGRLLRRPAVRQPRTLAVNRQSAAGFTLAPAPACRPPMRSTAPKRSLSCRRLFSCRMFRSSRSRYQGDATGERRVMARKRDTVYSNHACFTLSSTRAGQVTNCATRPAPFPVYLMTQRVLSLASDEYCAISTARQANPEYAFPALNASLVRLV